MKRLIGLVLAFSALAIACEKAQTTLSPYAGEESRQIKALSNQEIDDLLAGSGMGYAKVAELNGFPGPKHVLELAGQLALLPEQVAQTEAAFERMQVRAKSIGAKLVAAERELDQLFSGESVDSAAAHGAMRRAAELGADLRWTHVSAHLIQMEILTPDQRQTYLELRGYKGAGQHEHRHDSSHKHQM